MRHVVAVVVALIVSPVARAAPAPTDVIVQNTPAAPVPVNGSVTVANTVATPLAVRDVDGPARQPFQTTLNVNVFDGQGTATQYIDTLNGVPAGKRLVVEYVAGSGEVPSGQTISITFYTDYLNPGRTIQNEYQYPLLVLPTVSFDRSRFMLSQPLRAYASSGPTLGMAIIRSSASGQGAFQLTVSGYLVDAS